ncbi:MAG: hypothetical protein AAGF85_20075 [Bacteroidota bacterium]
MNRVLGNSTNVFVAYKKDLEAILVSPTSNAWFPKLHESMEFLLKIKDLKGTKSVGLREILIEHDIDDLDKKLQCSLNEDKNYIKIELSSSIV